MKLHIVSWNWNDRNMKADQALAAALGLSPDIICVQEMPEFMLEKVERSDKYQPFIVCDTIINGKKSYLCILVRGDLNIVECKNEKHCQLTNDWLGSRLFGWQWNMCLYSQSVLMEIDSTPVRVVNCHLDVTCSFEKRHRALADIAEVHIGKDEKRAILCGDLNTFGCLLRNFFAGWFFGIGGSELFKNEQGMLNNFLQTFGLARVFSRKTITHYWSFFSNLDHILIRGLTVYKKRLLPSRHNSDHRGLVTILTDRESTP